jgi:transposase, IS5 family
MLIFCDTFSARKLQNICIYFVIKYALMIRYKSNKQITIEEFKTTFEIKLDPENRWAKLAAMIPWNDLADIYYQSLSKMMGPPAIDARIVIGALIVKHKLTLDDRETIETIRENPYIKFFLGLSEYTYEDIFDRSLYTTMRYRMGYEKFDAMTVELIKRSAINKPKKVAPTTSRQDKSGESSETSKKSTEVSKNQGKLLLDATVADKMIVFPTDLDLIACGREESERIIDVLCESLNISPKPSTYRRSARSIT